MFLYNMFIHLRKNGPKLKTSRVLSINFQLIKSNALSKSTVKIIPGVPLTSLKKNHFFYLPNIRTYKTDLYITCLIFIYNMW